VSRDELQAGLRRHRRREMVRIGGRDLLGLATVDETVREISALAEGIIDAAVECARARIVAEWGDAVLPDSGGRPVAFCVLGMGSSAARSSTTAPTSTWSTCTSVTVRIPTDVRTASSSRVSPRRSRGRCARQRRTGLCFRVDLRLRPGGGEGPVAVTLSAALSYYETWGETWERAVWLKARPVGGDRGLGEVLIGELVPFVYRRYLDYGTLEDLSAMKRRVDASLRAPQAAERT
jgi:glutamate-ammonia-ligase adenylyltransferase